MLRQTGVDAAAQPQRDPTTGGDSGPADIGLAVVNARDFQVYGNRITGAGKSILLAQDLNFPHARNAGIIKDNELSHDLIGAGDSEVQMRDNRLLTVR